MSMTFHEKSQWVTMLAILLTFGSYFKVALQYLPPASIAPDILPSQAGLFIGATAMLVFILVAGHIALIIFDRRTDSDERDRLIELKGERYGAFVLASGVFLSLFTAVTTEGNAIMAHVLLASWVLSSLVECLTQIIMYRRGS